MSGPSHTCRSVRPAIVAAASTAVCLLLACRAPAVESTPPSNVDQGAAASPAGSSESALAADRTKQDRIRELIKDLGNPRYAARRAAASQLRQIGAEAFDALHAATENADPEIAASANYLLRQISVRWVRPEDPASVRAQLRQYGSEAEPARLQHVDQLAKLPGGAGVGGLCRIARYDRSPIVSRRAALAVIRPKDAKAARPRLEPALVDQELGASARASAMWLRQYVSQLRDPPAAIEAWKKLIDQESARLEKNTSESSGEVLVGLLWNLADLHRQSGNEVAIPELLDRMMALNTEESDETIVNLLMWLTENKSWSVLDAFLSKHQGSVDQSKRPLYFAALARARQGNKELAEQLAKAAADVHAQEAGESFKAAKELEYRSQFEWAVREYRKLIERSTVNDSSETIVARISLATLLQDYEHHKEAAEALEPLVKSVQGDGRVGQLYAKLREYYQNDLPSPDALAARYHFYRAQQYAAEKDYLRARGELDLAINFDPSDADVLIAMYRLPETDDKWREAVCKRVQQLTDKFQQDIDQDPSDASPFNQWAWLVSNTEGDFQKAIRYSHRSVELNHNGEQGAASYLDTLGRCYFAAGDYENAVKYERQAIEKVGYMQVMHRQLAEFEKALAEKKAASSSLDAGRDEAKQK